MEGLCLFHIVVKTKGEKKGREKKLILGGGGGQKLAALKVLSARSSFC